MELKLMINVRFSISAVSLGSTQTQWHRVKLFGAAAKGQSQGRSADNATGWRQRGWRGGLREGGGGPAWGPRRSFIRCVTWPRSLSVGYAGNAGWRG